MIVRTLLVVVIAALLAYASTRAMAAEPPRLKPLVTVSSEIVRLGDLIDGAGDGAAAEPLFRAPDLGTSGTVQASRILAAVAGKLARPIEAGGIAEVTVTRASRPITLDEVNRAIAAALSARTGTDIGVSFDPGARTVHVEPQLTGELRLSQIDWNPVTGRFDAVLTIDGSSSLARQPIKIGGIAVETVDVAIYARGLNRGDVIHDGDIRIEKRPKVQNLAGALASPAEAIGQAARRNVREGQPLTSADLMKPELVSRNQAVTLAYESHNMTLSIRAKAVEAGAMGEVVSVLNIQSNRVVQATITGPGRVSAKASNSLLIQ